MPTLRWFAAISLAAVGWTCLHALAGQEPAADQPPAQPAGLHIVVYQTEGVPLTVHLKGASGDVYIWVVKEPPAGAAVDPVERRKLEALKKLATEKK